MKPTMDVDGSHNMEWFLRGWVCGTDLPKYRLEYSLKPSRIEGFLYLGFAEEFGEIAGLDWDCRF